MVKHYCDSCGKEAQPTVCSQRLKGSPVVNGIIINFEIMAGIGKGAANNGDLCADCLLTAINICYGKPPAENKGAKRHRQTTAKGTPRRKAAAASV